jgi:glycerol-3-phosphate O-acyltransferase/dihydroxyacetone phosphate acyltransferase
MFTVAWAHNSWGLTRPHLSRLPRSAPTMSPKRSLSYDAAMIFWRIITQIFFREVRPRGAFHIPREGPVIFVAAPHNNQACT